MKHLLCLSVALAWVLGAVCDTAWADEESSVVELLGGLPSAAYEGDGTVLVRKKTSLLCCPPPKGCPCPDWCVPDQLFTLPCIDGCIAGFQENRAEQCFRIGLGAYQWMNYQIDDQKWTYGYPGAEGTYFYYVSVDFECPIHCAGCLSQWGVHIQGRFREDTTFRSFIDEHAWFYEAYAFLDFQGYGKVKAGKVWRRFGLDWDRTFWGNTPYYNGWKLDPDYMVAWENTWGSGNRLQIDSYVQLLLGEDGINGSITGGDSESSSLYQENLGVDVRGVGTYRFDENTSLALGVSGYVQQIGGSGGVDDETATGFEADLTFQWCDVKAYAEATAFSGTVNEAHYVTGGPTDEKRVWLVGVEWTVGAFTPRVSYSHGDYENPGGAEDILVVGLDIQLNSWLMLILEYVKWDVDPDLAPSSVFEKGVQVVLNWSV